MTKDPGNDYFHKKRKGEFREDCAVVARANQVKTVTPRGSGGEAPMKLFEATPFTLAKNASPNIMLAIGYKET